MARPLRLLILLALVGAIVPVAAPANATFPGINGRIAFAGGTDGGISTVAPDGSNPLALGPRIVDTFGSKAEPDWSPDGNQIAFEVGDSEIWVMNANGTGLHQLPTNFPDCSFVQSVSWSPDATQIAFSKNCTGGDRLFAVNTDGTNLHMIADVDGSYPIWSPDGTRLVYQVSSGLNLINADGSGATPLTDDFDDAYPDWSPDGTQIVMRSRGPDDVRHRIYVLDLATGSRTPLTGDTEFLHHPTWSPDGARITFANQDGGLFVMNADGSGLVQVPIEGDAHEPDWGAQCTKNCDPPPPECLSGDAICGGDDPETIEGTDADDQIFAGGGDDSVSAGDGDDRASGGEGNDRVAGDADNDVLSGDAGNDIVLGGAGSDNVKGGDGTDTVDGGGGNDTVSGGRGLDRLKGGKGRDTCLFDTRKEKRRARSCERFKKAH